MGIGPSAAGPYRFCPLCSGELEERLLSGDDRPRLVSAVAAGSSTWTLRWW